MNKRKILSTGSTGQISGWLLYTVCVWSALVQLNVYSQGCSVSLGRGDPEVEKLLWTVDQKKKSTLIIADYSVKRRD